MDASLFAVFLAIEINIDPTMLELGPLTLTWHGFFTAVGIIAGVTLGVWLARRDGIAPAMGQELALVSVPSAIIGARLFYVVEHWSDFLWGNIPDILFGITEGGLTLYGGLICGVGAGVGYAIWQKWPVGIPLDAAAPAMILGQTIGRIGDLINGEHHGAESSLPWAVRYTHPDTLGELGVSVHPTAGAYELLGGIAIFALLLLVLRPRLRVAGWVFCSYVGMYATLRFLLSFFRVDEATAGGIPVPQIVSAALVGLAIIAAGILYRRPGPLTREWIERVSDGPEKDGEEAAKGARRKAARA